MPTVRNYLCYIQNLERELTPQLQCVVCPMKVAVVLLSNTIVEFHIEMLAEEVVESNCEVALIASVMKVEVIVTGEEFEVAGRCILAKTCYLVVVLLFADEEERGLREEAAHVVAVACTCGFVSRALEVRLQEEFSVNENQFCLVGGVVVSIIQNRIAVHRISKE